LKENLSVKSFATDVVLKRQVQTLTCPGKMTVGTAGSMVHARNVREEGPQKQRPRKSGKRWKKQQRKKLMLPLFSKSVMDVVCIRQETSVIANSSPGARNVSGSTRTNSGPKTKTSVKPLRRRKRRKQRRPRLIHPPLSRHLSNRHLRHAPKLCHFHQSFSVRARRQFQDWDSPLPPEFLLVILLLHVPLPRPAPVFKALLAIGHALATKETEIPHFAQLTSNSRDHSPLQSVLRRRRHLHPQCLCLYLVPKIQTYMP